jgi:asparagine synthase (glutamine-hydrolysing)
MDRFRERHRIPADRPVDRAALWCALRTRLSDEMRGDLPVVDASAHKPLSDYFREWSRDLTAVDDPLEWAGRMDLLTYVPDDLMVKSDRASMSVGLELREPLLDDRLIAWLLRSPVSERFDHERGITKVLPRRALASRISSNLLDRPKRGFTPPLDAWLAGPLAEPMEEALERLEAGRLEPIVLPRGCKSWRDRVPACEGQNRDFLWRIVCFSEWSNHAEKT